MGDSIIYIVDWNSENNRQQIKIDPVMQSDLHWIGKGEVGTMRRSSSDAVLEYLLANYGAAQQALVNIKNVMVFGCWNGNGSGSRQTESVSDYADAGAVSALYSVVSAKGRGRKQTLNMESVTRSTQITLHLTWTKLYGVLLVSDVNQTLRCVASLPPGQVVLVRLLKLKSRGRRNPVTSLRLVQLQDLPKKLTLKTLYWGLSSVFVPLKLVSSTAAP